MQLLHAKTWWNGDQVTFTTAAENSPCAEVIAECYTKPRFIISILDYGARRLSLAEDDQLVVGILPKEVPQVVKGLKELIAPTRSRSYPVPQIVEVPAPPPINKIHSREPIAAAIPESEWR